MATEGQGIHHVSLDGISEAHARIFCSDRAARLDLAADPADSVVLLAALYVLIEDGLLIIHGDSGATIYPIYVYLDTLTKKFVHRCGAAVAFRSTFDSSPQAVLDQLKRLDLIELADEQETGPSPCMLKLEQLLEGAVEAVPPVDGSASDEEDTEWNEDATDDEGDDESEDLEGSADAEAEQAGAADEAPEDDVAFTLSKPRTLEAAKQIFDCKFGYVAKFAKHATHKSTCMAGLRVARDLSLEASPGGIWTMRPVPLRTVFDLAKNTPPMNSGDYQEFRSIMWGAPSSHKLVKIFCRDDREYLMMDPIAMLSSSIKKMVPASEADKLAPAPQAPAAPQPPQRRVPVPLPAQPPRDPAPLHAQAPRAPAPLHPQAPTPQAPAPPPSQPQAQPNIPVDANGDFQIVATLANTLPLVRQAVADLRGTTNIGLVAVPSTFSAPEDPNVTVLALGLATRNGQAWVVHFGALRPADERSAWAALGSLLEDVGSVKVTHDCSWLGPAVRRACGKAISLVWDTQVASGVAQFLTGVGGAAKPMQPRPSMDALFIAYDVAGAPEIAASRPNWSTWLTAALPNANVAFLAAEAVHLLRLAQTLNGKLGATGWKTVMRMSRAYSECLLPERQRAYAPGSAATHKPAADLPRGMPLEVFYKKVEGPEPGQCNAVYRLGPENEGGLAGAVPPSDADSDNDGKLWAPRAPSAAGHGDPAQNVDLLSILSLFPSDVAAAVMAVCRGELPAAAAVAAAAAAADADASPAPPLANDAREKPSPDSPSTKRRKYTVKRPAREAGGEKAGFTWPIEVILDVGRPMAVRLANNTEQELPESCSMTVDTALATLEAAKGMARAGTSIFSSDNRAGVPGTLHRISAMRGRDVEVLGLTYRVGRHLEGVGDLLRDVLSRLSAPTGGLSLPTTAAMGLPRATAAASDDEFSPSLLLLGPPGVGKTTLLRDVSRLLADDFRRRVVIVDTSNEIAGDGAVPHACIGRARRMMVPHRDNQHEVMREAVQNHNPNTIVIDEITDGREVAAARTIAQRGVALVGTAHGNSLETLLKNPELNPLVGGVTTVTVGDAAARVGPEGDMTKTKQERRGAPCFTTAIELLGKCKWRIHWDVAASVDALLAGRRPQTQLRWAAPDGRLMAQLEEGERHPGDGSVLKAAHLASKALSGDSRATAEWVADLSLLAARYA